MPPPKFGYSKTGLPTQVIRDIDWATPRDRLPPRALPDDVRAKLGLIPKENIPVTELISKNAAAMMKQRKAAVPSTRSTMKR